MSPSHPKCHLTVVKINIQPEFSVFIALFNHRKGCSTDSWRMWMNLENMMLNERNQA
jgi:hypothetical protein